LGHHESSELGGKVKGDTDALGKDNRRAGLASHDPADMGVSGADS